MHTETSAGGTNCVSCGRLSGTPYCPHCGERRASDRHYGIAHFAEEVVEAFTHADGTLARTFATLLRRPGELTRAYMAGIRTPYLKPLALFLIVNVLYFLWAGFAGEHVFDTPLKQHLLNSHYGPHAARLVDERIIERAVTRETYEALFNRAATVQAKTLVIAMVPMLALGLAVLQWRRRKPLVHHLVFALHLYAVLLLITMAQRYLVAWPLWFLGRPWQMTPATLDAIVTVVLLSLVGAYSSLAFQRAYGDTRAASIGKAVVLAVLVLAVLLVYRVLLFYTTWWAA